VIRPDLYVEQEGELVEPIDGKPLFASTRERMRQYGCEHKKERRHQAGATPTRSETLEVDALLTDLDRAREVFEAARGRAAQFKSSDPARTGNEYTRPARLSNRPSLSIRTTIMEPLMEPTGRNRWQPVANGIAPRTAQTS
jgi:hypothetical protein